MFSGPGPLLGESRSFLFLFRRSFLFLFLFLFRCVYIPMHFRRVTINNNLLFRMISEQMLMLKLPTAIAYHEQICPPRTVAYFEISRPASASVHLAMNRQEQRPWNRRHQASYTPRQAPETNERVQEAQQSRVGPAVAAQTTEVVGLHRTVTQLDPSSTRRGLRGTCKSTTETYCGRLTTRWLRQPARRFHQSSGSGHGTVKTTISGMMVVSGISSSMRHLGVSLTLCIGGCFRCMVGLKSSSQRVDPLGTWGFRDEARLVPQRIQF